VLIGSDHHLPFEKFASNEAIQCTEIFEFAQVWHFFAASNFYMVLFTPKNSRLRKNFGFGVKNLIEHKILK